MPKLPSLTSKKVINILKKKGFVLDRTKGSTKFTTTRKRKEELLFLFTKKTTERNIVGNFKTGRYK